MKRQAVIHLRFLIGAWPRSLLAAMLLTVLESAVLMAAIRYRWAATGVPGSLVADSSVLIGLFGTYVPVFLALLYADLARRERSAIQPCAARSHELRSIWAFAVRPVFCCAFILLTFLVPYLIYICSSKRAFPQDPLGAVERSFRFLALVASTTLTSAVIAVGVGQCVGEQAAGIITRIAFLLFVLLPILLSPDFAEVQADLIVPAAIEQLARFRFAAALSAAAVICLLTLYWSYSHPDPGCELPEPLNRDEVA